LRWGYAISASWAATESSAEIAFQLLAGTGSQSCGVRLQRLPRLLFAAQLNHVSLTALFLAFWCIAYAGANEKQNHEQAHREANDPFPDAALLL